MIQKDIADSVTDEKSFIAFLNALLTDRAKEIEREKKQSSPPYGPGANGWENQTIEAYLEASSAWARATINGTREYKKPDNPWTRCAQILLAGKFYE